MTLPSIGSLQSLPALEHPDLVGSPVLRGYGMKEFEARDLDGYILCFGEDVPAS